MLFEKETENVRLPGQKLASRHSLSLSVSENFSCLDLPGEKGRAAEKPAGIAGKWVAPSNPSVCVAVDASGEQIVLVCFLLLSLFPE